MKKVSKIIISLILVLTFILSVAYIPVSSYENDVETSTADLLLINLDTDTVVYSKKPNNKWYSGSLAVLMTYLLAYENIKAPDTVTFEVEKAFIDELPDSDGCLDDFEGETLTAKDLMAITLLTSGSDSAYALAYLVNGSDLDGFVDMMNTRADELGCNDTHYVSPGFSEDSSQHTTCSDTVLIYKAVRNTELFGEIFHGRYRISTGGEDHDISPEASILKPQSPYYFKYTNDAKHSYSEGTYANLAATTTYHNMTYLFVGLLGLNESEKNVYADARKLTTWAYLNLSDRKILDNDEPLDEVKVESRWGDYNMELYADSIVFKTLPNSFQDEFLTLKTETPESVKLPVKKGSKIGKLNINYDESKVDQVNLIVNSDEGLDMLGDSARFGNYVIDGLLGGGSSDSDKTDATDKTDKTDKDGSK